MPSVSRLNLEKEEEKSFKPLSESVGMPSRFANHARLSKKFQTSQRVGGHAQMVTEALAQVVSFQTSQRVGGHAQSYL